MTTAEAPRAAARPRLRSLLDRFDLALLAALFALSMAVLSGLILRVWLYGGHVTGADGFLVVDPMQYLNWLRQGLAAENLYDAAAGPSSFVHPGVAISGLFHALGAGVIVAYMVWKPVAVAALFAGAFFYVRRFLARREDRRLALVLALFTASPVAAAVGWIAPADATEKLDLDFISGEMWLGSYLWGYLFTAIAVGLMPLALLAYERGRAGGRGSMLAWAAAGGLLCSWLQPWQGATFAVLLVAAELVLRARGERDLRSAARDLAPVLAATAAPLVYYFLLSQWDDSWALADRANDLPRWPLWVTIAGLAPLAIPAAFAYRLPARGFGDIALRAWPLAALAIFYQPAGTFPFHAFQGLTLPLVVLGVLALRAHLGERPLPPALALAVAAVLIVPGTAYRVDEMRGAVHSGNQAHFLENGERDALLWLESEDEAGAVFTQPYLGAVVPAYTGRETWVGAGSWTPDMARRGALTFRVFNVFTDAAGAERIVRGSGARFLLADCQEPRDIAPLVGSFTDPPRRFGCATVWRVR